MAEDQVTLADLTTLRIGGPVANYRPITDHATLSDFLDSTRNEDAVLFLGGGSNIVASDEGFGGRVAHILTSGVRIEGTRVRAEAGVDWDDLVAHTLSAGLSGLEALSGIPGSTGATPIQNVGAYGAEVAHFVTEVEAYDRVTGETLTLSAADCAFGYRDSVFKHSHAERIAEGLMSPRFVVLAVSLDLRDDGASAPVAYAELARTLGIDVGEAADPGAVRRAVLGLRAGKGMVLDAEDHDTWSAGSFFTNPFLTPAEIPAGAPAWPQPDGRVKTSAAWLIEHAGFGKGFGVGDRRATLSTKHTLALSNRGQAGARDIVELARAVVGGVESAFGVRLHPEPNLVGLSI